MGSPLPLLLGGVLSLDDPAMSRWGPAGAWQLPVGDPRELGQPRFPGEPAFHMTRGVERSRRGRVTHQGADLADGRGRDTVFAAASGLVVLVRNRPNGNGYGGHVVLAHRLEDDRLAYTVYAHLARGSAFVHAGEVVCAGDPLGLVGRTGRATTPHLHFEVRLPRSPDERWENAPVTDPVEFAEAHFADPPATGGALARYVEWARGEALLPTGARAATPLTREVWWAMLARAVRPEGVNVDAAPAGLRDSLIEAGLLPEEEFDAPPGEQVSWSELARDVRRLHQTGIGPPHGPLGEEEHQSECEARFGEARPAAHPKALRHLSGDPTTGDACVLLADLAGPDERPPARSASDSKPRAKRPRGAAR